jgi:cobalt-zinc-cadmium efflux system outer membrane protein
MGMASRYDLNRLEVELASTRTKLEDAKGDIADRAGNLAVLLGIRDWRPKAAGTLSPMPMETGAFDNPRARALNSPATLSALGEEKVAQSAAEVARRERWPVPSISLGRAWTSEPFGAANFLGLSVEIPILDTRRGPVAKAEAEATAAAMRRDLVAAETAANLQRYADVIGARETALRRFEADAAARLPVLKEMSENAYRLGRGSIFELLDSTRSRYELHQTRIDLMAALVEAQLRYLGTSGELERGIGRIEKP